MAVAEVGSTREAVAAVGAGSTGRVAEVVVHGLTEEVIDLSHDLNAILWSTNLSSTGFRDLPDS